MRTLTNPAPTPNLGKTLHLHQSIGEDASKRRSDGANHIEDGITLLKIVARVPGGQEINCAREETSLENTKEDAEPEHLVPLVDKSETDENASPKHADGSYEVGRTDLAHEDCCRRLKEDVWDKENQTDDTVAVAEVESKVFAHTEMC